MYTDRSSDHHQRQSADSLGNSGGRGIWKDIYTGGDETPVWANFMDDQVSEGRHGIRASGFINQESNESDGGP